jgi:hypothetical protein
MHLLGRSRSVVDPGEGCGDLGVAACCGVLVPKSCTGSGVSESGHQLREGSPGLRRKHGAGVPQVMEPQVGPTSGLPRTIERSLEHVVGQ